jgi:hypothetical protein
MGTRGKREDQKIKEVLGEHHRDATPGNPVFDETQLRSLAKEAEAFEERHTEADEAVVEEEAKPESGAGSKNQADASRKGSDKP